MNTRNIKKEFDGVTFFISKNNETSMENIVNSLKELKKRGVNYISYSNLSSSYNNYTGAETHASYTRTPIILARNKSDIKRLDYNIKEDISEDQNSENYNVSFSERGIVDVDGLASSIQTFEHYASRDENTINFNELKEFEEELNTLTRDIQIKIGDVGVGVLNNEFIKGQIIEAEGDEITLKTATAEIKVPSISFDRFSYRQRYDIREVELLLKQEIKGVNQNALNKNIPLLLKGDLTKDTFKAETINEKGQLVEYQFKLRIEKKGDKLEIKPYFKKLNFNLNLTEIKGEKMLPEEIAALEKGETVILERKGEAKEGEVGELHLKFSFDKDLNSLIPERLTNKEYKDLILKENISDENKVENKDEAIFAKKLREIKEKEDKLTESKKKNKSKPKL